MADFTVNVYSTSSTRFNVAETDLAELFPFPIELDRITSLVITTSDDGFLNPDDLLDTLVVIRSNSFPEGKIAEIRYRTLVIEQPDAEPRELRVAVIVRDDTSNHWLIPLDDNGRIIEPNEENLVISAGAPEWMLQRPLDNSREPLSLATDVVVNIAPVAENDVVSVSEGGSTTYNVLDGDDDGNGEDTDDDGDVLTVVSAENGTPITLGTPVTIAGVGTVQLDADGELTFEADPSTQALGEGEEATADISYTIEDPSGASSTARVLLVVEGENDAPTANDIEVSVNEDGSVAVDVLSNVNDPEGDELTVELGTPQNGSFVFDGEEYRYTPNSDFSGEDTFEYSVDDGNGGTATGTVTVTVNPVNDAPVGQAQTVTGDEDTVISGQLVATDIDDDDSTLTYQLVGNTVNGEVEVNSDGSFEYTPDPDFFGSDAFTFRAEDPSGAQSSLRTVILQVADVPEPNRDPVAVDDTITTIDGRNVNSNLILGPGGDTDPDGDSLRVQSASINGTPLIVGGQTTVAGVGTFGLSAAGALNFTPDPALSRLDDGDSVSFSGTYTVIDQQGGSDVGDIEVVVDGANNAPETTTDSAVVAFETAATIDVLENDSDADDGDVLTVIRVSDPGNGTAEITLDGRVLYTPDAGYTGSDSFTYVVTDGTDERTQTVTITVEAPDNTAPTAQDGSIILDEDSINLGQLIYSDEESENDELTVEIIDDVDNGTLELGVNGAFTYTPADDYNGSDSFTYRVSDGELLSEIQTISITVEAVNDLPTITPLDVTFFEDDDSFGLNLLAGVEDIDEDALSVEDVVLTADDGRVIDGVNFDDQTSILSFAAGQFEDLAEDEELELTVTYDVNDGTGITEGTATIAIIGENDDPVGNEDFGSVQQGQSTTIDLIANDTDVDGDTLSLGVVAEPAPGAGSIRIVDGDLEFTAAPDFAGDVTLGYSFSDGNGGVGTSQVTITVTVAPNLPPVAVDDSVSVGEDADLSFNVVTGGNGASADTDEDGDPLSVVRLFDRDGNQFQTLADYDLPEGGRVVVTSDGQVTFVTDGDFNDLDDDQTAEVQFSYEITDGTAVDTGQVTITVLGADEPNRDPVADNFVVNTNEDEAVVINFDPNVSDEDGDALMITPNSASVRFIDGVFIYTPAPDVFGTDTFTYTVADGKGGVDDGEVTVNIAPVNDDPTADGASVSVAEDGSVAVDLDSLVGDIDGDDLTIELGVATNGTVGFDGEEYRFTPDPDYNGPASFSYSVRDGNGGSAAAIVDVDVTPVNDAPEAADDSFTIGEAGSVTGNLITGDGGASADSDVDDDTLTVIGLFDKDGNALQLTNGNFLPEGGSLAVGTDGGIFYDPQGDFDGLNADETGTVSFTYVISDGDLTDTGEVTIIISGSDAPNADPIATDFFLDTLEDVPAPIDFASNIFDDDGDVLTITTGDAAKGTVSFNDGSFVYTPFADVNGTDSFSYSVDDGNGGLDTGTVFVNIEEVNDDPTANNGSVIVDEDDSVIVDFVPLVDDIDGDFLTVSVGGATNGAIVFNGFEFVYTPNADYNGPDSFTYTVSDDRGGEASATIDVDVTPMNDAPVAANDEATTDADTAVTVNVLENDTDIDSPNLTVTVAPDALAADKGVVSVGADGSITYDPNGAFDLLPVGEDATVQFTYTVSDGELTDTASVSIEIEGTFEVVDPVVVVEGTAGIDRLVGTDADEFVVSKAGRFDFMSGGGGSDTFVFGDELSNGVREIDRVLDFVVGEDSIQLATDQYSVAFAASGALITAGSDQDLIFVYGGVTSVSDLGIVVDEFLF